MDLDWSIVIQRNPHMYRVGIDANGGAGCCETIPIVSATEKRDVGCEPKGDGLRGHGW